MTRNLKILVLGLVAALVLTALPASSASAFTQFNSESGTTAFKGTQAGTVELVTNAGAIKCSSGTFRGMVISTVQTTLETSDSTATSGPESGKKGIEYSGCSFLGFINVALPNNGCQFRFHANGTVAIVSGGGKCATKGISYEAGGCTVHVFPQTGLNGVTYVNTGSGTTGRTITIDVNATSGISGITYTAKGCILGGDGTFSNGIYRNATGTNGASVTIGGTTNTESTMTAKGVFVS